MTTHTLLTTALLTLVACGGGTSDDTGAGDADTFCDDLAASNDGCWNEALDETCREVYAECGEQILVMESCPVQLGCAR